MMFQSRPLGPSGLRLTKTRDRGVEKVLGRGWAELRSGTSVGRHFGAVAPRDANLRQFFCRPVWSLHADRDSAHQFRLRRAGHSRALAFSFSRESGSGGDRGGRFAQGSRANCLVSQKGEARRTCDFALKPWKSATASAKNPALRRRRAVGLRELGFSEARGTPRQRLRGGLGSIAFR